jgi:hypothetical protein
MFNDVLRDIVDHTNGLGIFTAIKITSTDESIRVYSLSTDNGVMIEGVSLAPVNEFQGIFGIHDIKQFSNVLKNREYRTDANIYVEFGTRGGELVPEYAVFENATGDFKNRFRLMSEVQVKRKLPEAESLSDILFDIDFEPSSESITRFKSQSNLANTVKSFIVYTEDSNVVFAFGDDTTCSGSLTFHKEISGKLTTKRHYSSTTFASIMALNGTKRVQINGEGIIKTTITTEFMEYSFTMAATK